MLPLNYTQESTQGWMNEWISVESAEPPAAIWGTVGVFFRLEAGVFCPACPVPPVHPKCVKASVVLVELPGHTEQREPAVAQWRLSRLETHWSCREERGTQSEGGFQTMEQTATLIIWENRVKWSHQGKKLLWFLWFFILLLTKFSFHLICIS